MEQTDICLTTIMWLCFAEVCKLNKSVLDTK